MSLLQLDVLFIVLFSTTMPFRRKLPAVSNSANVKNSLLGSEKSNSVAEKDVHFWLPLTNPLLKPGLPAADTLHELLALPKAHVFVRTDKKGLDFSTFSFSSSISC